MATPTGTELLVDILAALQRIEQRLGMSGEGRSSVEVSATTTGTTFKVKAYDCSPIEPAETAALESFRRVEKQVRGGPERRT